MADDFSPGPPARNLSELVQRDEARHAIKWRLRELGAARQSGADRSLRRDIQHAVALDRRYDDRVEQLLALAIAAQLRDGQMWAIERSQFEAWLNELRDWDLPREPLLVEPIVTSQSDAAPALPKSAASKPRGRPKIPAPDDPMVEKVQLYKKQHPKAPHRAVARQLYQYQKAAGHKISPDKAEKQERELRQKGRI